MVFIKQNINIKKREKLVKERAKKLLNPDQSKPDSNSQ